MNFRAVVGKNRVKRVSKKLGEDCQILAAKGMGRVAPAKAIESVINQADEVTPDIIENHSTSQSDNRPNPLISYP